MLRSARLTLKQHRFEIAFALVAALAAGAVALWINARMLGVNLPAGCLDALFSGGGGGRQCEAPISELLDLNYDKAGKVFAAMAVLPFVTGLLAGVPLVGRELETRTAQTAWGLAASRRRWLGRQLWPIGVVLGVTVAFAAVAAWILEATRMSFAIYSYPWQNLGLFGPLVVARAFAALGVGLIAGAALGRTLPAFIVGAVVSFALVGVTSPLREGWAAAQPQVVFDQAAMNARGFDGVLTEQAWRLPDGRVLRQAEGMATVPAGIEDQYQWLNEQGYETVALGITGETARNWEPLEIAGFVLVSVALIAATVLIVDRRRPT